MDAAYIIVPVADVYKNHTFSSEVVTQALMYEKVTILDTHDNWSRIEQWDGYQGWINNFYLSDEDFNCNSYEFTINRYPREGIYSTETNNPPSSSLGNKPSDLLLPYGVKFLIKEKIKTELDTWFRILITHDFPYESGDLEDVFDIYFWIKDPSENLWYINNPFRDCLEQDLERLMNIPYRWGGKTSFGFDCSGLIQTVFKANGISMPRDSKDQYEVVKKNKINFENAKFGDLIFFQENEKICHVGIMTETCERFYHCSGRVKIGSLDSDDIYFYDEKLSSKFTGIFSISEIIKEQFNEQK